MDDVQLEKLLRENMYHYFSDDELLIRRGIVGGVAFVLVQIFRVIDGKRTEIGGFQFSADMLTRNLEYLKHSITMQSAELAGTIWKAQQPQA